MNGCADRHFVKLAVNKARKRKLALDADRNRGIALDTRRRKGLRMCGETTSVSPD